MCKIQAMVNAGVFHPYERGWYVTCSNDGTVRQWDVEERKKGTVTLIFVCITIHSLKPEYLGWIFKFELCFLL